MADVAEVTVAGARPKFGQPDRFRKAREFADMEQEELARAIGVSRVTVSKYERGAVRVRKHIAIAWAVQTGVAYDWLCPGQDADQQPSDLSDHQVIPLADFVARRDNRDVARRRTLSPMPAAA